MTTTNTLFTLHHGPIPDDLIIEPENGEPPIGPARPGSTGWWMTGVDWDSADDMLPYLLDAPGVDPATLAQAGRHFEYIVGRMAADLLGVTHNIIVTDWTPVPGSIARWTPKLLHERHTLTLNLISGRSQTWWGLPRHTVENVDRWVADFDADVAGNEDILTKRRTTTIDLGIPLDEHDTTVTQGGKITKRHSTIRIATITQVETDVRHEQVTDMEMVTMRARHADKGR